MNACARARSRLATATRLAFPASQMACQFLRAMKAAPRMPQRQVGVAISRVRCVLMNSAMVPACAAVKECLNTRETSRRLPPGAVAH